MLTFLPAVAEAASVNSGVTGESRLVSELESWLSRSNLTHSLVALEVMQLPTGKILFSANGNRRFVPASAAKLFVSACAYDKLGGDYRYSTKLSIWGHINGDTAHGDLIVEAGQDPTFEYQNLRELLDVLKSRKIKRLDGVVKIAAAAGGPDYFHPGWLTEDWGQEWMPVSSDLVVDRNIAPAADPGRGMPASTGFADENQAALSSTLLSAPDLVPGWATYQVNKSLVQAVRSNGSAGLVITNPGVYHKALIESIIRAMGIRIGGQTISSGELHPLSGHSSAPLSTIIRHTLHASDNLYAQQLLRTIGAAAAAKHKAAYPTLEQCGLQELNHWLSSIGVNTSEVVLVDGCGLSRKNCVSPHALNLVLKHMSSGGFASPFLEQMKLSGSPAKGEFRFKTGSMDSVRSISGVVRTTSGELLAVTAMVNGHTPSIRDVSSSLSELSSILQTLPRSNGETQPAGASEPLVKTKAKSSSHNCRPRKSRRHKHLR